ncbi:Pentapeptide repeat family protein [hydrothermal vent metagenome]|uniref:Pentapeptide repeat family protein n=1 Tax=hydrothermal vent metagenome TaxID=652676 RepID=A0A3B0WT52_9ZZZZ
MSSSNKGRWYIKLGETVQGPFPNQLIGRYLILGRITQDMLVSQDKEHWAAIKSYPAMVPEVLKEAGTPQGDRALMLARIREDERSSQKKNQNDDAVERRDEEDQLIELHRQMRDDVLNQYNKKPRKKIIYYSLAGLVLLTLVGFFIAGQSTDDIQRADCNALAQPGVNWSGCNRQGEALRNSDLKKADLRSAILHSVDLSSAQLQQADLAYADLSRSILISAQLQNSNLKGANLRRANLRGADLTSANLSYAELVGSQLQDAILKQAIFDHAIWVNGETCLPGSVGECLIAMP